MQDLDSELRAFMAEKGLDQVDLAKRAKVSQASVSRVLNGGTQKRRGRAFLRLCKYIQKQREQGTFQASDKERVHELVDLIWGASKAHAKAVTKVVDALNGLRTPQTTGE